MAPAGKTPKMKGRRRWVKGVHGVLPEEVVGEGSTRTPRRSSTMAESLSVTKGTVQASSEFSGDTPVGRDTHVGRERDGERVKRRAPVLTTYKAQRRRPEGEGKRGGQHTSARKARKCAQGQGAEHHRCQFPVYWSNRGGAGPSKKVATPATGVRG